MSAELAARRTAAAAAAADFTRETDAYLDAAADRPDFSAWAWRLSAELRMLLDELDRPRPRIDGSQAATHIRSDGSAVLGPEDLLTALSALADGAVFRVHHGDSAGIAAYRALSWRLGDDRG